MDNLFEGNIEKNLLNNKIISTKEDILNNNKIKELINSIVNDNERYNSNKKEMQKIIMKEYIRKIDGVASNEAKSLAKKLGVILEDGHTIVKPHTRHYNKQK